MGDDSDIEACVSRQLFVEKMLALDPATYTEPGLRFVLLATPDD